MRIFTCSVLCFVTVDFLLVLGNVKSAPAKGFICQMSKFQNCRHYELVTTRSYQGLIPTDNLTRHCSNLDKALKCAQTHKYLQGCSEGQTLEFYMITYLYRSICVDFNKEYKNSSMCFQLPEFKDAIEICSSKFEHPHDDSEYCNYFEEGLICLDQLHEMVRDSNCEQRHFLLQNRIFRRYVEPLRTIAKCPEPEGLTEPTTLPTATERAQSAAPHQLSPTTTIAAPTFADGGATGTVSTGSPISRRSRGENGATTITHNFSLILTVISLVYLSRWSIKFAVSSH